MLQGGGGLDLDHEAVGAEDGGELGLEDLDGDLAVVLEVVGEVDGGHAAGPKLALDAVAVGQCRGEAVVHGDVTAERPRKPDDVGIRSESSRARSSGMVGWQAGNS